MKRFTPQYKKKVILEILVKGKTFKEVAAKYKCSRQAIYGWILLYKKAPKKTSSLKNHYRRGRNHPKKVSWKIEKQILDIVVKKPDIGISGINKELAGLGYTVSRHGIYNILLSYQLQTKEFRNRFSLNHPVKTVFAHNLVSTQRARVVEEYLHQDKKISQICTIWKISRPTFYSWLKRYNEAVAANSGLIDALSRNYKRGEFHHRATGKEIVGKILEIVKENPSYSVHKIFENLPRVDGKPVVGHHGIQNILFRENLNTVAKRLAYAAAYAEIPGVSVAPLYVPEMPLYRLRQLIAPFTSIPKLLVTNPKVGAVKFGLLSLPFLLFGFWVRMLASAPHGSSKIGLIFASISLVFGIFFFIYSIKYYVSILIVLKLAQGGSSTGKGISHKFLTLIAKFFGIDASNVTDAHTNPLSVNLDKVSLERQPFVSIHAAIYNEKRVISRLMEAFTAQIWENYEVIIADDSTDETTEIAKQFLREKYGKLRFSKDELGTEIYRADATDSLPSFTLIHRTSRSGFKGAALQKALENTNPLAEYISVFDSDFVPYPDTISQFVKTFQESCGGLDRVKDSNIAAVQGYQWHVLNKSQNWVTRGVRAEYAGSYVIERAGEEIYGGLKQIAGSVYAIRTDVIRKFGWGSSITEDFELTLRLYEVGYKVAFTPYIQAPAEAVSTLRRLIRQRMRWAEGASFNIKVMFSRMLNSKKMTHAEKMEFAYLSPYYLQAAFFVIGTFCWFLSEAVFGARLPFWTAAFGWSLVFTNLFALPLMNIIGLFLEESSERDYVGIFSFVALSYIVVPFQAFAAIKGFLEAAEGPWFRTPKTGTISDDFGRPGFGKFFGNLFGRPEEAGIEAKSVLSNDPVSLGSVGAAGNLAFAGAYNYFDGNIKIRRRTTRWVANSALVFLLVFSILAGTFAKFVPEISDVSAQGNEFKTLADAKPVGEQEVGDGRIDEPMIVSHKLDSEKSLEYIFHPEPRVRTKLGNVEIEMKVESSKDLKLNDVRGYKQGSNYVYYGIFDDFDLYYSERGNTLEENFVLSKYRDFESIDFSFKLSGLVMAKIDDRIQFASEAGGDPLLTMAAPFMYEQNNPEVRSTGIEYRIEKEAFGYKVKKVLTGEGKKWLSDPKRVYPLVVDPPTLVQSSPITSAVTEAETDVGSFQRKIVYSSNSSAWYAFEADGGNISYEKCLASAVCDANGDWSAPVTVSADAATQGIPSAWFQRAGTGAGMIFVAWIDDSTATQGTADSLAFETINTASSDAQSGQCNSADVGSILITTRYGYIAVGNNGDAMVGYNQYAGTLDTEVNLYEVPTGTCTFTSRFAGSGQTAGSQLVAVVPVEVANNRIVFIYNDAGGNGDLRESQFDVSSSTWNFIDNDVDGANNLNRLIFSAVSDGTDIWVLRSDSATAVDFFRCSSCTGDTAHTWTTTDATPFSSLANITEVSLSYIATSPSNTLVAMILKDATNEQAYFQTTDADTISWQTEYSFAITAGDNGNLSSTFYTANDTEVGMIVREGGAFTFSTLPEQLLALLVFLPFLPKILRKIKRKGK